MSRTSIRGALAGLLCTTALAALSIHNESYFGAEWLLRDFVSAGLAAHRPPDPRIVIVTISDTAARVLAEYGRPQTYTRELYALAIEELRRAGAAVIAIDVLLAEENAGDPAGDRHLAQVASADDVVLGAQTMPPNERTPPSTLPPDMLWRVSGPVALPPSRVVPPIFGSHIGTMRITSSPFSANVHSYPMADRVANGFVPSLAAAAARQFLRARSEATVTPTINGAEFRFDDRAVPVDRNLSMTLRWHRGARRSGISYKAVDFDKVIVAALARTDPSIGITAEKLAQFDAQFRGKAVLIGQTAVGLDLRATPLSPTSAGVEIHANALDNLISGQFDVVVNRWLVFPFIALAAALLGIFLDFIHRQIAAAATALAFVAAALAIVYASATTGRILPAFASVASLGLTYVVLTVINFIAEQEQTVVLRTTFGRYVSPQILEHVLAHPEGVHLGGERRDLTILFSDIRGFTTISERSEPEQVVDMLNEYLTRMVEILLAHGGTLDKFIGDAVMGFWNAPAADPDHPRHAVACAIEMIRETAKLRERWMAEGKAALRIGVGINSGEAVVGNIGAEKVFGYTVIGDAVNLASRLEGKNKDYGTEIIISEFTRERIGDTFETVYLDEVKVKGKEKAVRIYEVRA
ncbi:MAG TPA: adenylate/guanylate cyclase domain-containing protein [Thermoanaerobaculia bacterium]